MDYVTFHSEPPSNLTTMVMAFGGWINAGRAATGTIRHLDAIGAPERPEADGAV